MDESRLDPKSERERDSKRPSSRREVFAISIGLPRDVDWEGRSVRTGIFKEPVQGEISVGALGLEGDGQADPEVHGGRDKAVYAYDESNLAYWRACLGRRDLGPGKFGENLTLRGVADDEVAVGDVLSIGTARFQISQPRQPCFKLGLRMGDPKFPKRFFASERVGYYLRVLEGGRIAAGDPIEIESRDPAGLTVREVVSLWRSRDATREQLERAVALDALASAWREPFRDRLERIA